jgi:hypothetical protein
MSIKINKLEIENTKRVKAVKIEPTANGLTILGGKNNNGKTSVLDSIAWILGGNSFKPSDPQRDGSVIPPNLRAVMSNGLVVERKGVNSTLKVTDPSGQKGGQALLDGFVEQLALNLPKFMGANNKEKANTLLKIIGVGDKLHELEQEYDKIYSRRTTIGQIADQKAKFAKEQPYYPDAPKEPISAGDLIKQQQDILAQNGENQRKRHNLQYLESEVNRLTRQIEDMQAKCNSLILDRDIARKSALDLHDEGTEELENNITNIESINIKVRANLDKDKAEEDALDYANQYATLTTSLDAIKKQKMDLLNNAGLPLPGLSIKDGELIYFDKKWDGMSGSDQLKVAVAIVRKLNPNCGFVLMDKLEQMDLDTLREFGQWLESEGLQAIATRVSTGDECSIIIEDGYIKGEEQPAQVETPKFKAGEF